MKSKLVSISNPNACPGTLFLMLFFASHVFFQAKLCISSTSTLAVPLKSRVIPYASVTTSPEKLRLRRNVSLTATLAVGRPPQNVSLVIDTGSELSWLNCDNNNPNYSISFYPNRSTTYSPVPCSSPTCTNRTRDLPLPASCDSKQLCHAAVSYADASSFEGNLASDAFRFGISQVSGLVFACMYSFSSTNPSADRSYAGLMGMNRGSLSFVSQMGLPKFSYCISGSDSSGLLLLGGGNFSWLPALTYTPLIQISTRLPNFDRSAYTVHLEGIKVSGKLLAIPNSTFEPDHTGAGQTMVDSGTQFTFLLGSAYKALRAEFLNRTTGMMRVVEDPNFVFEGALDLCYRIPARQSLPPRLPGVRLVFRGAEMSVSGERLLYRIPDQVAGTESVYCFTFGNSDLLGADANMIGHHHQQNLWMEFDIQKGRIGMAEVQCDKVVRRLGLDT